MMDDVDDPNYLMDHTICIFLVNPEGKIEEYFTQYKVPGEVIFTTLNKYVIIDIMILTLVSY